MEVLFVAGFSPIVADPATSRAFYAEVLGYACNNDAYHMLAPRPDASCAARCIQYALADARVSPAQIDYINAHATGTPLGDAAETLAIKQVFGEHAHRIPVSSTKPFYAHPLGASGARSLAVAARELRASANAWRSAQTRKK